MGRMKELHIMAMEQDATLVWESAGTEEPGDENADSSWRVPEGCTSAYYSLGPNSDGTWPVELIAIDHAEEVSSSGRHLGVYPTSADAKNAAQRYEETGEPPDELVDAIMRYGFNGFHAGMAHIAALMREPAVAALLARGATVTSEQRAALSDAAVDNFSTYRIPKNQAVHRVARETPEQWRDFLMVKDRAMRVLDRPTPDPDHFCVHALADIVWATAARAHLTDDEYQMFARPWTTVMGETN